MSGVDLAYVDHVIAERGRDGRALIPILQDLQTRFRWLPGEALQRVVDLTGIPAARVAGVATFYDRFRHLPAGEHLVCVCHGTACHVKGSEAVDDAIRRVLGLKAGEDTDADRRFTIQGVACLGCCTLAPVVQIGSQTFGHVQPAQVEALLKAVREGRTPDAAVVPPSAGARLELRLGAGSCCGANGSTEVHQTLLAEAARRRVPLVVKPVGCTGICHRTPLLEIRPQRGEPVSYAGITAAQVPTLLDRHLPSGPLAGLLGRLGRWLGDAAQEDLDTRRFDIHDEAARPFTEPQVRIATAGAGEDDPHDLDAYVAAGGFAALRQALADGPATSIAAITASGLRGRGGAGFPTGRKWQAAHDQPGQVKYVVCNGDEGDPGAFMDRMLLESWPYRVIEGLAIAASATGATEAVFYIRAEYPLAVARVREALRRLAERNWLGIPLTVRFQVVEGAGAFVCGEETALIASVEGRRGTPRLRPPFPVERGIDGHPTCVNNVETLACVPWILRQGATAFAAHGTAGSRGTKVFALAGKVRRGGLIEVPMGMSMRRIVMDIGGGVAPGRTFKGVQIGGPSGGCIPADRCDVPVDFEELGRLGAIMGSGGLVVLDDRDCMVDLARYFLRFTQDQSCGKCTFCRVGTRRMQAILERLCQGTATAEELAELERLAHQVSAGSLCGLGRTAPNPVLTTLQYYRDEYLAHLEGRCPAGRCTALIRYAVAEPDCTGCSKCAQVCPVAAIPFTPYQAHTIDSTLCTRCDACRTACPHDAIRILPREAACPA